MLRHLNIIISKYYDIKIIIPNKETLVLRAGAVGHSLVRTIGRTRRIPVSFRRTARTHRRRRSAGFFPRDIYRFRIRENSNQDLLRAPPADPWLWLAP
jgi:hypothetical protein